MLHVTFLRKVSNVLAHPIMYNERILLPHRKTIISKTIIFVILSIWSFVWKWCMKICWSELSKDWNFTWLIQDLIELTKFFSNKTFPSNPSNGQIHLKTPNKGNANINYVRLTTHMWSASVVDWTSILQLFSSFWKCSGSMFFLQSASMSALKAAEHLPPSSFT